MWEEAIKAFGETQKGLSNPWVHKTGPKVSDGNILLVLGKYLKAEREKVTEI